jgi:hypothetical protein
MENIKIDVNLGFLNIVLLVNIILKLVKVINWSWAIVLWPLWAEIAIVTIMLLILWVIGKVYRI